MFLRPIHGLDHCCLAGTFVLLLGACCEPAPAQRNSITGMPKRAQDQENYGSRSSFRSVPQPQPVEHRPPLWHYFRWPEHLRHRDPNDPLRHVGLGHPLTGTSWRNRPWHVGWLVGGLFGDDLIADRVSQGEGLFGGYRLGCDVDHYFGSELRFAFANLDLIDPQTSRSMARTSRDHFWDAHLLYYPWGDAHWRPFCSLGMGLASFYFRDDQEQSVLETAFTIPLGMGVKYHAGNWWAVRCGLMDNWSLGARGLSSMHNISLTAGVEVHWGGRH